MIVLVFLALVALCVLAGIGLLLFWWSVASQRIDDAERRFRKTMFAPPDFSWILHFPSMTFANLTLLPSVAWGQTKRTDGPSWLFRNQDPQGPRSWEELGDEFATPIETAYQRFLRSDVDISGEITTAEWFLEHIRKRVLERHRGCHIVGYDRPDESAAKSEVEVGQARELAPVLAARSEDNAKSDQAPRDPAGSKKRVKFRCLDCGVRVSFGASECGACGQRYRYDGGTVHKCDE